MNKIITLESLNHYHENVQSLIDSKVQDLMGTITSLHVYCTDNDILRLFDPSIPEEPVEPDTPEVPEETIESIGSISGDNSIVIDETQLENGTYTLRYVDSNNNVIDNFNEITSFEINK